MDSNTPVVARRLKEARLRLGMSQFALGVAAGIDEMSASPRVNQYERGKHAPDFQMVSRFATVLGVPPSYLYTEADDLAEALMILGNLPPDKRMQVLDVLRQLASEGE